MIRGTTLRHAGLMVLAAVPLALQIAAEARQAPSGAADPRSPEYFETRVRPVLAANCYDCHTDERMGGLRVDSRESLLKGGRSGPAIVPGDPEQSLLIAAVRQTGKLKMPKGGQLTPEEIAVLADWVKAGAVWGASAPVATSSPASVATATPAVAAPSAPRYVIKPEQRAFWSFQPLRKPPV